MAISLTQRRRRRWHPLVQPTAHLTAREEGAKHAVGDREIPDADLPPDRGVESVLDGPDRSGVRGTFGRQHDQRPPRICGIGGERRIAPAHHPVGQLTGRLAGDAHVLAKLTDGPRALGEQAQDPRIGLPVLGEARLVHLIAHLLHPAPAGKGQQVSEPVRDACILGHQSAHY